jgi:hypothetical protein
MIDELRDENDMVVPNEDRDVTVPIMVVTV